MNKKKLLWISILAVFIIAIVVMVIVIKPKDNTQSNTNTIQKANKINIENVEGKTTNSKKTETANGILYSLSDEELKADVVIGDNYFDTQINDMMLNYQSYKGKKIEIEGMYLDGQPYTFVGRYSTSNLCAYCPVGYSYIEYQWKGEQIELKDQESWIKIIGTLEKGNDSTSYYQDYYYIKALSMEIMNEKGQETVNN